MTRPSHLVTFKSLVIKALELILKLLYINFNLQNTTNYTFNFPFKYKIKAEK